MEILVRDRSRSLKMVPFESLDKVIYSHSVVTVVITCYHFRDEVRYWLEIAIFHTPAFDAPVRGSPSRGNIAIPFGTEKLQWCGYAMVKKV